MAQLTMQDLPAVYEEWVQPFYLSILHGNFRHRCLAPEPLSERDELIARFRRGVREIDTNVVDLLFQQSEWRARLTVSWFCGIKGWRQYEPIIGESLIASEVCYAGQGYCFALACFAEKSSAGYLCRYLDKFLPQLDKFYDQHWALPALMWIDRKIGTSFAGKFLEPGGLWEQFGEKYFKNRGKPTPLAYCKQHFDKTISTAFDYFLAA